MRKPYVVAGGIDRELLRCQWQATLLVKSWAMLYDAFFLLWLMPHVIQYQSTVTVHAIIVALVDVLFLTASHARDRLRRGAAGATGAATHDTCQCPLSCQRCHGTSTVVHAHGICQSRTRRFPTSGCFCPHQIRPFL